jgi:teichuronic acid biosynthesis glycosyltransferase TuaG
MNAPGGVQWEPKVAVIMPCHNGARTIAQAVQSVINQTFRNWELVVVDDGSTDASSQIIQDFSTADPRIWSIRNDKPSGAANARNNALRNTRARYVAFLDSDDAWLPHKLEAQLKSMEEHGAALACGSYDVMDGSGAIIGEVRPTPGFLTYQGLLTNCSVGALTAILDRSLCGEIQFHSRLSTGEDYQLWLSLMRRGLKGFCLSETLAIYRVHGKTLSSNKFTAARNRWRVYREFEKHNVLKSAFYFSMYTVTGILKMGTMRRHRLLRGS